MSRLQQLIQDLCPDGVEYKSLGELGSFYGGLTRKKKSDFDVGNAKLIAYMNVFSNIALDIDVNDRVKIEENEKQNTIKYGDILFTASSETPDECGMSSVLTEKTDEKLYLNSFCFGFRLHDSSLLLPNFSKHLFRSAKIRKQIMRTANGVTRFNISRESMKKVLIPIPPLPVQQEIVRILDTFTELIKELNAELDARRKQYEYYRDLLLTFDDDVPWVTLKEVLQPEGYIRGPFGSTLKKEFFTHKGVPIYEQQHAIYDSRNFRYFIDNGYAEKLKRFMVKPNDLIVSCSGTIGKISIIAENDPIGIINQTLLILRLDLSKVVVKYVKYYLECFNNLIVTSSGGAITNIQKREIIKKILIPVPLLKEQKLIVDILDRFETIINDKTIGIPAEIELRQKQYEYYRDKLLDFKEVVS